MKRVFSILCLMLLIICLTGCAKVNEEVLLSSDYLRIHIRANSNNVDDQNVKYEIKDSIILYLTPLISNCSSKEEMIDTIKENFLEIEKIADGVLVDNGFNYTTSVKIDKEYFPTKTYGTYTLDADYYDALIVELGEGVGNNWWCVVYPPLCFVQGDNISTSGFKYKSLLIELIEKFFK